MGVVLSVVLALFVALAPLVQPSGGYRNFANVWVDGGDVCDVVFGGGHIFVVRFVFCVVSLLLYFFV